MKMLRIKEMIWVKLRIPDMQMLNVKFVKQLVIRKLFTTSSSFHQRTVVLLSNKVLKKFLYNHICLNFKFLIKWSYNSWVPWYIHHCLPSKNTTSSISYSHYDVFKSPQWVIQGHWSNIPSHLISKCTSIGRFLH